MNAGHISVIVYSKPIDSGTMSAKLSVLAPGMRWCWWQCQRSRRQIAEELCAQEFINFISPWMEWHRCLCVCCGWCLYRSCASLHVPYSNYIDVLSVYHMHTSNNTETIHFNYLHAYHIWFTGNKIPQSDWNNSSMWYVCCVWCFTRIGPVVHLVIYLQNTDPWNMYQKMYQNYNDAVFNIHPLSSFTNTFVKKILTVWERSSQMLVNVCFTWWYKKNK